MKNLIYLQTRLLAKAGRSAGAQRLPEFEVRDFLPSRQRSRETERLTREIFERIFQRREPGEKVGGSLQTIGDLMYLRRAEKRRAERVRRERSNARPRAFRLTVRTTETLARIEERKGAMLAFLRRAREPCGRRARTRRRRFQFHEFGQRHDQPSRR